MNLSHQIKDALIVDIKVRIFEECFPRIKQCLDELSIDEIWHKPNMNSNSIGNLVLHVCGNLRQYVLSGINNQKDQRTRDIEFSEKGPLEKKELHLMMKVLEQEMIAVFDNITDEDLIVSKKVQGFNMNVTSILIHITEHLSYHTGQIAFYTKLLKDIDLKFYGDLDLNIKST